MAKKVRVLIVDDSASVRQTLTAVLQADPDIEVIGTAPDPFMAAKRIQEDIPDVITLDVEMPRMDGITFLRKLMQQRPIPVVMCSSLTEAGTETLLQALEAMKCIAGFGASLQGRLLRFDALRMRFRTMSVPADADCPYCAPGRAFPGYSDYAAFCAGA